MTEVAQSTSAQSQIVDPRLDLNDSLQTLKHVESTQYRKLTPQTGSRTSGAGYKQNEKISWRIKDASALWDKSRSYIRGKFRNQSSKTGSKLDAILTEGVAPVFQRCRYRVSNTILEESAETGRWNSHLHASTSNQDWYDTEAFSLYKPYRYSHYKKWDKDGSGDIISINEHQEYHEKNDVIDFVLPLDFFGMNRDHKLFPIFNEVELECQLASANMCMTGSGTAAYELYDLELVVVLVYPKHDFLAQIHKSIFHSEGGLQMVIPGCTDVYTKDVTSGTNSFQINLPTSYSDIQSIVCMFFPKSASLANDDITLCPLPDIDEFSVKIQGTYIKSSEAWKGLAELYNNMRECYEHSGNVAQASLLNWERFQQHTALCLNMNTLPHIAPNVIGGGINTRATSSTMDINFKLTSSGTTMATFPANLVLHIFITHKRLLRWNKGAFSVGV